ncbi:MAG: cytochrome c oxidase assembly protein [Gammaproteobacteria bacterium]|nr:cytochrome c oxidase assembly protein [Gammaproteobacteria bacterium]
MSKTQTKNRRVVVVLMVAVIGMFGFGFALVPLYNVFCDAFGINGRITSIENGTYQASAIAKQTVLHGGIDKTRQVTMQFLVTDNRALDLEFRPLIRQVEVNPGEVKEVAYYVKNLSDKEMVVQAIPSVSPGVATKYLAKIECFCFSKQVLKPGEAKSMPLRFVVDSSIPRNIPILTLSYRFIELKQTASTSKESNNELLLKRKEG